MGWMRFTQQDMDFFSAASHDTSPLHMSADYARKTIYGEPPVFGILGAMAALGRLSARPHMALASVSIEFHNPLYLDVDYAVATSEDASGQTDVKIYDAGRLMTRAVLQFCPRPADAAPVLPSDGAESMYLDHPNEWHLDDLREGLGISGSYAPARSALDALIARWGIAGKGVSAAQLATMLWSSYLVGMQLPGIRANCWWVKLQFRPDALHSDAPLAYETQVAKLDERVGLVEVKSELRWGDALFAEALQGAFVRPDPPVCSVDKIEAMLPRSQRLAGKVALVIGGSRGLGAAISQALALQSCTVLVNFERSAAEAAQMREDARDAPGAIELLQGDAADSHWCQQAREQISVAYGGLDLLVCNACPPNRPTVFAAESVERFQRYVGASLALVSAPLSVFLGTVAACAGWTVVVSSAAVRTPPLEGPQYVAAKSAVEGLAHWAAAHHKQAHFLVARPPKLLTDQTNTPFGRQGAMSVERAAAAIVGRLCQTPAAPGVELLEAF
jgi:NAD(P)-dependent dehydrogenase (short-subunit alcohol dehydrogenase family)